MDGVTGFGGGLLIGLACAGYVLMDGRIAGITGILGGLVDGTEPGNWRERLAFVAGLVGVPWLLSQAIPSATHLTVQGPLIITGGLLVAWAQGLRTAALRATACVAGRAFRGAALWPPGFLSAQAF